MHFNSCCTAVASGIEEEEIGNGKSENTCHVTSRRFGLIWSVSSSTGRERERDLEAHISMHTTIMAMCAGTPSPTDHRNGQ